MEYEYSAIETVSVKIKGAPGGVGEPAGAAEDAAEAPGVFKEVSKTNGHARYTYDGVSYNRLIEESSSKEAACSEVNKAYEEFLQSI